MAIDAREFVAEELWLLIGIVTFAVSSGVLIAGFGTLGVMIAVVGWFLLAPVFLFWGEEIADLAFEDVPAEPSAPSSDRAPDALEELKRRYAAGEIDDDEFERRLERLVGVEDALAEVFADRPSSDRSNAETEFEREVERER